MFGPWLSQLGLIITALVHMKKKKYARIPYTFVCRPSLPWTEVGSPSAANGRSPNAAQCKGNNWADNFSEAQNRIKLLFHMPHLFARVIVSSFSVSESLFLSDQDKYEQENIQNRLVKKSYKLREDSDQTVRMRMLIWLFAGHTHVPHLICRALGHI